MAPWWRPVVVALADEQALAMVDHGEAIVRQQKGRDLVHLWAMNSWDQLGREYPQRHLHQQSWLAEAGRRDRTRSLTNRPRCSQQKLKGAMIGGDASAHKPDLSCSDSWLSPGLEIIPW